MSHSDNRDGWTDGLKARQCIRRRGESGRTIHNNDIREYILKMRLYIIDSPGQNDLIPMLRKPICQPKSGGWILMKHKSFLSLGRCVLRGGLHLRVLG